MEKNQPDRPGTRKLPGAPARPAPGPAPAGPRPRPLQGGPGAAPRRPAAAARPPAPPPSGGGLKKFLMLFIIVALGGIIAAGFIRKDPRGVPLWLSFLDRAGLLKATLPGKPAEAAELALKDALEVCSMAKYYARAIAGAAEGRIETVDKARATKILAKLEDHQAKLPKALEEIKKTSEIAAKDASAELQETIKKAGEQLAKQQKITAELEAAVGRWKKLAAEAPETIKAVEAPEVKAAERTIPKRPHPWGAFKVGAWTKTTTELKQGKVKQPPESVTKGVVERSLAEASDTEVTLKVQTTPEGGTPAEAEEKSPVAQISGKILAEDTVAGYDCLVVESESAAGAVHTWVPRRGRGKDLLTIKIESPAFSITATRVTEEIIKVGDRNLNVFKVESNGKEGDAEFLDWVTLCAQVPGYVMEHHRVSRTKTEQIEFMHTVVDFGIQKIAKESEKPKDPEKPAVPDKPKEEPKKEETAKADPKKEEAPKPQPEKPKAEPEKPKPEPEKPKPEPEKPKPEPEKPKEEPKKEEAPKPEPEKPKVDPPKGEPAKPPQKKADVVILEADQLVIDGAVHFKQLAEAMKSLPGDATRLKALSQKCDTAVAFFVKAKELYSGVRETASDQAKIDKNLDRLQKILERLQKYQEEIKSKM